MGLEFTNIPDRAGPAIYLLGSSMLENRLRPLGEDIDRAVPRDIQVFYIDSHSSDGAKIMEFYNINSESLPAILIVMDDDTLYKSWTGMDLPNAQTVGYEISQVIGSTES